MPDRHPFDDDDTVVTGRPVPPADESGGYDGADDETVVTGRPSAPEPESDDETVVTGRPAPPAGESGESGEFEDETVVTGRPPAPQPGADDETVVTGRPAPRAGESGESDESEDETVVTGRPPAPQPDADDETVVTGGPPAVDASAESDDETVVTGRAAAAGAPSEPDDETVVTGRPPGDAPWEPESDDETVVTGRKPQPDNAGDSSASTDGPPTVPMEAAHDDTIRVVPRASSEAAQYRVARALPPQAPPVNDITLLEFRPPEVPSGSVVRYATRAGFTVTELPPFDAEWTVPPRTPRSADTSAILDEQVAARLSWRRRAVLTIALVTAAAVVVAAVGIWLLFHLK
ncbi:hypothetical protein [Gryllotalpicola ginsengisoli]|uniref:hypothetical protein n=1 Tax=Gryllotalpicola ginsengisoli TaxID=444608 RepID=UPI0003B75850|nr:hypothetical protein [Gryllotalpicola ginsengisoli]